jgi:hypothetical protein
MAALVKFNGFIEDLASGVHNLGADKLCVVLTDQAPSPDAKTRGDIAEIAASGGYKALPVTVTGARANTNGYQLKGEGVVFKAQGGSIGPFQYAVLANDKAAGKPVIGYWDNKKSITLDDGETFTVNFGDAILTLG